MAKQQEEKVYHMSLSDLNRYLSDRQHELAECTQEITEIQTAFNAAFQEELRVWQEKLGFCYPRIIAGRKDLPAAFGQLLDRVEAEERAKLEQEIATLEKELSEGRAKMDALLAKAQQTTSSLAATNPRLDQREQELKAQLVQLEDEYAAAYEQIEKLDAGFLSWLTHSEALHKLKQKQRQAKQQQTAILQQLRQVRQEWSDDMQKAGDVQGQLHQEWEQLGVHMAEAQTRHDYVQANLAGLAQQNGLQRVLEELSEAPEMEGELGVALKDLAQHNNIRHSYEKGLESLSEGLGLGKGIGGGLARFQESLGKVLGEQRQYNLKDVKVPLPQFVVTMNETWKELRDKVKDEKYMGMHPLECSKIVEGYVHERLTDENIKALFEKMGAALSEATSAWN